MTQDNDNHMRRDCPAINGQCDHFSYQCDRNSEVAIIYCCHPGNPNDHEDNCTSEFCPRIPQAAAPVQPSPTLLEK